MKFSEDPRAWKRVGYGAICLLLMPMMLPMGLLLYGLYCLGKVWDEV